jgi:tRNA(Ile)-lysidine synthase
MANSNSPRADLAEPDADSLLHSALERALGSVPQSMGLAVAISGGPDSSAMAICASQYCRAQGRPLLLFHIHHGLHRLADQWQTQVQQLADLLGCRLLVRKVQVQRGLGLGLEGAARQARREALIEMAHANQVGALLLAHHQQDQAETVLMRLLRGAGVRGLRAMDASRHDQALQWLRPWLGVPRSKVTGFLERFSLQSGWQPVDDPSNRDSSYARGLLRTKITPVLDEHWPAWSDALARHARQAAWAERLLGQYGEQLMSAIAIEPSQDVPQLSLAQWRLLDEDQQVLVLRAWFDRAGAKMPTEARLNELLRQLRQVHALGHDRSLSWQQSDCTVTCVRARLIVQVKL